MNAYSPLRHRNTGYSRISISVFYLLCFLCITPAFAEVKKEAFSIIRDNGAIAYILTDDQGNTILSRTTTGDIDECVELVRKVRSVASKGSYWKLDTTGGNYRYILQDKDGTSGSPYPIAVLGRTPIFVSPAAAEAGLSYLQALAPSAKIYITIREGDGGGGGGGGNAGTIIGILFGVVGVSSGVAALVWYFKVYKPKADLQRDHIILKEASAEQAITGYAVDREYVCEGPYFEQKWEQAGASEVFTQALGCPVHEVEDRLSRVSIKRMASGTVGDLFKGYFYALEESSQTLLMVEVLNDSGNATTSVTVKAETLNVLKYGEGLVSEALGISVGKKTKKARETTADTRV